MKIIGFSGKKQSGKSTAVHDLIRRIESQKVAVKQLPFAAFLKEIVRRCFNIDPALFETDAGKNQEFTAGITIRQLLQYIGTDIFRELDKNAWVNAWRSHIADYNECCKNSVILVPDVRFPNEVEAIQAVGGKVIRLTRAPFAEFDTHESETALDNFVEPGGSVEFDHVMDNTMMSIAEQNKAVWQLVNNKGWI